MSKVLKTIVNVILFCAIVVAAGLLIPPFAGITTVMVDDVDMQTNLPQGSVAYAVEKDRSELKQGDKVLISQEGRQYVYVVDSIDGSSVVLDDQLKDRWWDYTAGAGKHGSESYACCTGDWLCIHGTSKYRRADYCGTCCCICYYPVYSCGGLEKR